MSKFARFVPSFLFLICSAVCFASETTDRLYCGDILEPEKPLSNLFGNLTHTPMPPFQFKSETATAKYLRSEPFIQWLYIGRTEDSAFLLKSITDEIKTNENRIAINDDSACVRLTRFLLQLFRDLAPTFPSETTRTEWIFKQFDKNLNRKRFSYYMIYDKSDIAERIFDAWVFAPQDWSDDDLRILNLWFDRYPDDFFRYKLTEHDRLDPQRYFNELRYLGWYRNYRASFEVFSTLRVQQFLARSLDLVIFHNYNVSDFIDAFDQWIEVAPKNTDPVNWLAQQLKIETLDKLRLSSRPLSESDLRRVAIAIHFGVFPATDADILAWIKALLIGSRKGSLAGSAWNEIWKFVFAKDSSWVNRYSLPAILNHFNSAERRKYDDLTRRESVTAKGFKSELGKMRRALNIVRSDSSYDDDGESVDERDLSSENGFFSAVANFAERLSNRTRRDLRTTRGARQVENLTADLREQIEEMREQTTEDQPRYFSKILSMFEPMSESAIQEMRSQAIDLLDSVAIARSLYATLQPLRVQVHNHPDPILLADLRKWRSRLETTGVNEGLSPEQVHESLILTDALITSVQTFLNIVRFLDFPSSASHTKTDAIELIIEKLTARREALGQIIEQSATRRVAPVINRELKTVEQQLYGAFMKVQFENIARLEDRIPWMRLLLRNLVFEGYVNSSALDAYQRYALSKPTTESFGAFVVALEERIQARMDEQLRSAGLLRERIFQELMRSTSLLALSKAASAFGQWRQADLEIGVQKYRVVIMSSGAATGVFKKGDIEFLSEVPLDDTIFSALFLERLPSLANHVVMKMRALQAPIVVLREGKEDVLKKLQSFRGKPIVVTASEGKVSIQRAPQELTTPARPLLPVPSPLPGLLGPKGQMLNTLARDPQLCEYIAPYAGIPEEVIAAAIETNRPKKVIRAWLDELAKAYPQEWQWHFRSDFDAEDGATWNGAGVFQTVSFVSPFGDNGISAANAIRTVVNSWLSAPLAQIFGQHLAELGHRPKVLVSASRVAVVSGVATMDMNSVTIEVQIGSGGVVAESKQCESWRADGDDRFNLISLEAGQSKIIFTAEMRRQLQQVIREIRAKFPTAGTGWEMEFGVDAHSHLWIHQLRAAF